MGGRLAAAAAERQRSARRLPMLLGARCRALHSARRFDRLTLSPSHRQPAKPQRRAAEAPHPAFCAWQLAVALAPAPQQAGQQPKWTADRVAREGAQGECGRPSSTGAALPGCWLACDGIGRHADDRCGRRVGPACLRLEGRAWPACTGGPCACQPCPAAVQRDRCPWARSGRLPRRPGHTAATAACRCRSRSPCVGRPPPHLRPSSPAFPASASCPRRSTRRSGCRRW